MSIGVLGGTFDPIHNGHLMVAEEARRRLNLVRIILVPAGQPRLKPERPLTPPQHRLNMLQLAIAGTPHFTVSTVELEREGPSYTVDTIAQLKEQVDAGDELFFILGWDSLARLPEWREPSRLIRLCYLVAAPRPGYPPPDLNALESIIPGISLRVVLLDKPRVDISASVVRDRVARRLPIGHLVPEPVKRYIKQHKLYLRVD